MDGSQERCPSGRRGRPAKALYGVNPYRGFESLALRQYLDLQPAQAALEVAPCGA